MPGLDPTTLEPVSWPGPGLPPGLGALLAQAREGGFDWIASLPDDWAVRPFTDAGEGLFVVFAGRDLVAIAAISADPFVQAPDTGRLKYIYVSRDLRGFGIADRLVRACLKRAGPHWRRIRLHTDNPVAARLYARYGFEPVNEHRATHALATSG